MEVFAASPRYPVREKPLKKKKKNLNEDETNRNAVSGICFNTFQVSNSQGTWNIEVHD